MGRRRYRNCLLAGMVVALCISLKLDPARAFQRS
jgi:hypothetical protein